MKIKIIILLSLCLSFIACDSDCRCDPPPEVLNNGALLIVQFKKPEYKDYIMVVFPDTARVAVTNQEIYFTSNNGYNLTALPPTELIDVYHKSPYIDLVDNYVLVDWKTTSMIENILLASTYQKHYLNYGEHWEYTPEEALIKNKWEDFDDINRKWPLKSFFVDYPVERFFYVTIDKLNSYYNNGLTYPSFIPYEIDTYIPWSTTKTTTDRWNELVDQKGRNFVEKLISEADVAYSEYRDILVQMINEDILLAYVDPEDIHTHLTNK